MLSADRGYSAQRRKIRDIPHTIQTQDLYDKIKNKLFVAGLSRDSTVMKQTLFFTF